MIFPANYDRFVNNTSTNNVEDLEKIDLRDFMSDPTEADYQLLKAKIIRMDGEI
jgi:hypothetical protein